MPQVFAEELKSIPMSPNLGESLERGHRFARDQMHRFVMLEHLLLALTEDPEAALILQSANVDLGRLSTDVSGYLGRLMEDMRSDGSSEPRPDPELLRVLQAAASAAQQSKRRQIDGAIVLAAIVGDGKSPAAGLLKTHGMTFEEAIRALQRANTKARLKPIPKAAPAANGPADPKADAHAREADPQRDVGPAGHVAMPDLSSPAQHVDEPSAGPEPDFEPSRAAPAVQSADDILAAARARIQRRAAVLNQSTDPSQFTGQATAYGAAPALGAVNGTAQAGPEAPAPAAAGGLSNAMRELLAVSGATPAPAPQPEPSAFNGADHRPAASHPLAPPMARAPEQPDTPFGGGGPGPAHMSPPLGPPGGEAQAVGIPAMNGPPGGRPARMNRPAAAERAQPLPPWAGARPAPGPGTPGPNGPGPNPVVDPRRLTRASAPLPPFPGPPQRKGAAGAERGPLVESIPRRMKLSVTSAGEVRIAREKVDGLVHALVGRAGPGSGEPVVARALSVRLRSPSDSFFIEPTTPETQWIESGLHLVPDEALSWRWNITPKHRGKGKLTLLVSLRSVGLDGAGEEVGPPDRAIEVKVRGRFVRKMLRTTLFLALLAAAAFLGRVGGELGPMLLRSIRYVTGL